MQKTIIKYNKIIYSFMIFIKLKHQTKPVALQRAHILWKNKVGIFKVHGVGAVVQHSIFKSNAILIKFSFTPLFKVYTYVSIFDFCPG